VRILFISGESRGGEEVEVMRSNGLVGIPKSEEAKTNVGEDTASSTSPDE
jgi:hypothetical protein